MSKKSDSSNLALSYPEIFDDMIKTSGQSFYEFSFHKSGIFTKYVSRDFTRRYNFAQISTSLNWFQSHEISQTWLFIKVNRNYFAKVTCQENFQKVVNKSTTKMYNKNPIHYLTWLIDNTRITKSSNLARQLEWKSISNPYNISKETKSKN